MSRNMKIAVVGAGLGGLAAAALLQQAGYDVHVYEQAASFGRIGAGIHLGPNVVKVLNKTSVGEELYRSGMEPEAWISRAADTGEESFRLPLRGVAEPKYGARYLTVHRGDLHALMTDAVNAGTVSYGKKLVDLQQAPDQVTLRFEDGTTDTADIVIGADGLNSMVRRALIGVAPPVFTGVVGHRVIFPASLLKGEVLDDFTKWWADDRHLITYYMSKSREEVYIVTGAPESEWTSPASFVPCSKEEFRACFEGFHPEVQKIIDLVPADGITKWAFFEHDPLPLWSEGRIVLLGDACHPMKPHMGQGAAMAIEDAAVLVRCIEETGISDYRNAFVLYEANRKGRTSRVQATSSANEWLRYTGDPDWVFGYDPFNEPLVTPAGTDAVS